MAPRNIVVQAYDALIMGLAVISGAIFGLMAFFIAADVLMRNTFGAGLPWVIETMEYAMYVATAFAAPWVLREGGHVCVDIVVANLPRRIQHGVTLFTYVLGSAICWVIFYYGAIATWQAFKRGSMVYKTFTIPEWPINLFVPLCMALVAIEFLRLLKTRLHSPPAQDTTVSL